MRTTPGGGVRLQSLLIRDQNSLDFIRFAAASAVVLSHAFQVSGGTHFLLSHDPVSRLTGGQRTLGTTGVAAFFAISGFLIPASFEKTRSGLVFLWSRALRILPALAVTVGLTVLVLGPAVTTLHVAQYFQRSETYRYLANATLAGTWSTLPGVFEHNPLPGTVNGSLWTLTYEARCYLLILVLGLVNGLRRGPVAAGYAFLFGLVGLDGVAPHFAAVPGMRDVAQIYGDLSKVMDPYLLLYFLAGSTMYVYRSVVPLRRWVAIVAALGALPPALLGHGFSLWLASGGTYVLFYLAASPRSPFHKFGKYGDFSYGIYIIAFPLEQLVAFMGHGHLSWGAIFALSYPATLVLAVASWNLVEGPALQLKRLARTTLERFAL